ncbi:MAG TPA: aminotransferase class V-fold PLP-dependent enzyme [Vicinamibacterales bacterium]|nr:aminotransferase class V-fold PLP-dependent enzyme [Vicinamibacterales bacterium]
MSRLSVEQFRRRFPIFERRCYVNSCSQGALSTDVEDAVRAWLASWHEHGSPWEAWVEIVEQLRTEFAAAIGASREEIAIVPSASAGINAIVSALDFTGPRRTVVLGDFEFPTMAHPWLAAERRGAAVRWARAAGDVLSNDAYAAVVDEGTLIVPATHVCFRNGHRTDIRALTELCHQRGAFVFLDDYQRTGSGPIDVHELGVDFMVTGALKYLIGPAGVAFLYVRRDLVERLEPTVTGWFGRANPFAYRHDLLDWPSTAARFEGGTPPVPSGAAALAGVRLLQQVGFDEIGRHVERLVARYRAEADAGGFAVRTPADAARRGPLVVIESTDGPALVSRLAARGIVASCRGNGLRVSFHAYNNDDDVAMVIRGLEQETELLVRAPAGARRAIV